MKIYVVRHGIAEERSPGVEGDPGRRLTPAGAELMKQEARALAALDLGLDVILTSPLVRAVQTAQILAEAIGARNGFRADQRLAPGFTARHLGEIVSEHRSAKAVLIVGHEPSLSEVVGQVTGGSRVTLKKGGIARIDIEGHDLTHAVIAWLLPPRLVNGEP